MVYNRYLCRYNFKLKTIKYEESNFYFCCIDDIVAILVQRKDPSRKSRK